MQKDALREIHVDVAVIGAGTAGLAAYRAALAVNPRVVMIESGVYGTTCARVGCMPSKLLIAAGEAAHHARHAGPFGVHAGNVEVNGREVMARLRAERDRFVGFVVDSVDQIDPDHKIIGRARFVGPGLLDVQGQRVHARSVVIATGSAPFVPPMFEPVRDRLVVNDDVFEWESLPASVAVFGAGVIGLEIGQALSRLGVRVRTFGRGGTIGPLTDPAVKASALAAFREEMPLHPDARVLGLRRVDDGVEVTFVDEGGTEQAETFAYALIAAGRKPSLAGLGLENAGIELVARGGPVFERTTLLCKPTADGSGHPVFVAGDANDDVPLLHEAADEGRIAGDNAARFPKVTPGLRRSLLAITFTEPQIAIAGATLASLPQASLVVGEVSFVDQGRSRVMRQNRGLAHVYADRDTGRFLGAELVGPQVEHIAHLLAWAHQQRLTIDQMLDMPFYHPVVEEGLRTALRDAATKISKS